MREYIDTFIKVDHCAQYLDDIKIAAYDTTQLKQNIRATFKSTCNARTIYTIKKCHFGVTQDEFLAEKLHRLESRR